MSTNNKIYEESLSWLMRQNEGLSVDEQKEFLIWLEDKRNKKEYEKNKNIFFSYNILNDFDKRKIKNDINKDKKIDNFKRKSFFLAASVIFIFICFNIFNFYKSSEIIYQETFYTKNLVRKNIILPDKSVIDLDVKSKLLVNFYENKRLVNLKEGKAIFKVQKDKNRIFKIKSGNNQVEVVGTEFELENLNNITNIKVIEGKVKISHFYNKNKIKNIRVLTKEQSLSINDEGKVLNFSDIELKNIGNWKQGILKFQKANLEEVLKEFKRYNNFDFDFENYELTQLTISGVFNINNLESFLDSLPEIYPIEIKKENKKIKISQKN